MRRPSAKHIKTTTDRNGISHLTFGYRGYEYTITDEDDEPMVDKHIREQDLIDARIERQQRAEQVDDEILNVDEIFRKLGWV